MKGKIYCILALVVGVVLGFLLCSWWTSEDEYSKKTEEYRQKLTKIIDEMPEKKRMEPLRELATEIGAGTIRTEIAAIVQIKEGHTVQYENTISESELVQNIHNALQTRTMIATSKNASKSFWTSVIAAIIAAISAAAAWAAVLKKDKITCR